MSVPGQFEVSIEARSEDYDENDSRWQDQVSELHRDLQRDVGDVRKHVEAQAGAKGGVETILVALGSAGAISGAVDMFKAWLSRDRSRSITIRVKNSKGEEEEITISSTGMNAAVVTEALSAALKRQSEPA